MGNRSYGEVRIGGLIPDDPAVFNNLVAAIKHEGSAIDSKAYGKPLLAQLRAAATAGDNPICVYAEDNNGGCLDAVVECCQDHKLPYIWTWHACSGAYGAGTEMWSPDMETPATFNCDDDGNPQVPTALLKIWLEAGASILIEKVQALLAQVITLPAFAFDAAVPAIEPTPTTAERQQHKP